MDKVKLICTLSALLLVLGTLSLTGCIDDEDDHDVNVVVTLPPQKEWVEAIGGEHVGVTVMVPTGEDPHSYEPRLSQLARVAEADIYFKVGSGIEFELNHMETIREQNRGIIVVDGSRGIDLLDMEHECDHEHFIFTRGHGCDDHGCDDHGCDDHGCDDHGCDDHGCDDHGCDDHGCDDHGCDDHGCDDHGCDDHGCDDHHHGDGFDPHIWLSPMNVNIMIDNFVEVLVEVDPDNEDVYRRNADAYKEKLTSLHNDISVQMMPHNGKSFLIYHPAFNYFAHEYGLVQVAIEDEGKEPGPAGLAAIIDQAVEDGITIVFVSPQFDSSNAQAIAEAINGEVLTLDPLAEDYVENLRRTANNLSEAFEV